MENNLHQTATDKIIAMMEAGDCSTGAFWHNAPISVASGDHYHGINALLLSCSGYQIPHWGTYKAWQEKGAQVRKGEKAEHIVYWKMYKTTDKKTGEEKTIPLLRGYTVFNAAQVDGYTPPETVAPADLPQVRDIINRHGIAVVDDASAFYRVSDDSIHMPKHWIDNNAVENRAAVMLHELGHWTGHQSRLNRLNDYKTNKGRAMEELIAELSAAFSCARLGITGEPRPDHAAYISGWLELLRDDNKAIFKAATAAEKAVDYLTAEHEQQSAIAA